MPSFITVAAWVWVFTRPPQPRSGWYDFDIMPAVRAVCAVIVMLASWLIYFMAQVL